MFVVCGEALMDVFASANTDTGMTLDARVGGSPFNVATGLARLKQPVALLTSISHDFLGERLLRALEAEKVDTSLLQRTTAPTALGLVGLDSNGIPSYHFYGHGCADRLLEDDDSSPLPAGTRVLHLGSYTSVVEPVSSTLAALVEREHERLLISYDPNIRLNVEPSLERWRYRLEAMMPRSHLLKISSEDLDLILPGTSREDFAAQALRCGVQLVVVTSGSLGATAWTRDVMAKVPGVPVEVIDTVGAGDTFQAALLSWLAEQEMLAAASLHSLTEPQLQQGLLFAANAAAITCSRRGADMPRRDELR